MLDNITEHLNTIISSINGEKINEENKSIFILSGPFGTGKTLLTDSIISSLQENKLADCIININNSTRYTFLTELMASTAYLIKTPDNDYISNYGSEADYNNVQFKSFLSILKKSDPTAYNAYCLSSKLKSQFEWADNYKAIKENDELVSTSIKEIFPKKGEQRLLFETYTIAVESMIVDLMTTFYPITDSENPIIMKSEQKKKVFIAIDEIDSINGSIYYYFLNYLIPYFYNKTFGDFVSYHISFIDANIKISEFFEFYVLVSSRNDFINVNNNILENLLPFIYKAELNNISYLEFLESGFPDDTKSLIDKDIFIYSKGVPALLYNILPFKTSENIKQWFSGEAYKIITKDLSAREIDYLHILTIVDDLDDNYLKYFDKYKLSVHQLKNFLLFNPNLCEQNNKERCSENIRFFISEYLKEYSSFEYEYLSSTAAALQKIEKILKKYSDVEFEFIKVLAFLNEYDDKLVFALYAKNNEKLWEQLYKKDMELFPKTRHQIAVQTANQIKEFVKEINPAQYEELSSLYSKLAGEIKANERTVQYQKEEYLESIKSELKELEAELKTQKHNCKEYQDELMKTENLMIELRRKLADSSLQSNILLAAVNIVITLIVFCVTYYLPAISDLKDANSPVYSIQIILYCIGAVFGGISIFFSAKTFSHYQKTAQFDQIKLQIEEYESEKNEIQYNMKECKTNSEIISSKISNLKKQLADF